VSNDRIPEVDRMSEKFTSIVSEPINIDGVSLKIGASIGIAAFPFHGNKISALIDIADKRMYEEKHAEELETKTKAPVTFSDTRYS
jgi:GGDEF domain-containing protein